MRVTYAQNWPVYNAAQVTEKVTFLNLLRDLCANVSEPTQTRGRPRIPLSDMPFAAAFKVYSTASARRFMTDLRDAQSKGLISQAPHYNSLFRCLESETVTPIIRDLIVRATLPLRAVETDFAIDSTGFTSTQLVGLSREDKYGAKEARRKHDWVKVHAVCGVKTNVITAIEVTERNTQDAPYFAPLVTRTTEEFNVLRVLGDKAYSSYANLELTVSKGAEPFIPFKSYAKATSPSPTWNRLLGYFIMNREEFLSAYHKRSNAESTFSAIKRLFDDSVRSKTRVAQINEVLLKVLAHNIRCLIHAMAEMGISPISLGYMRLSKRWSILVLFMSVLLLSTAHAQSPTHSPTARNSQNQEPEYQQHQTQIAPTVRAVLLAPTATPSKPVPTPQCCQGAANSQSWNDWLWQNLATLLLVIVAIWAARIAWRTLNRIADQARTGEMAANAAKQSAETATQAWDSAKRIDRAWVMVDRLDIPVFVPLPEAGTPPPPVLAVHSYTNYGKTPAFIVEVGYRFVTLPNLAALSPEPNYRNPNAPVPLVPPKPDLGIPLLPNKSTNPIAAPVEPSSLLTQPEINNIDKGEVVLYAYGFIEYRDVFDDPHETRWGYLFVVPAGFSTYRGWQMAGPDAYNWQK